jgi:hypothetical protein
MIAEAKLAESRPASFPESKIRTALLDFWNEKTAEMEDDPFAREKPAKGTLYELVPELDSLTVVNSFLLVEKILEFNLPAKIVKAGGYTSPKQMLDDLLPKIRKEYDKQRQ